MGERRMQIRFGAHVRDRVTGFEGMLTGRAEFMAGGPELQISPPMDSDAHWRDPRWFHQDRVEVVLPEGEPAPHMRPRS